MVRNILNSIVFILFVSFPELSFCQEIWKLSDCINYAIENNLQIKVKELQEKTGNIILKESKNSILPDLKFAANQNLSFGRTTNLYDGKLNENHIKSNDFYLSSSFILFNGMKSHYQIQQNKINFTINSLETEVFKNDIQLNILQAYLQILLNAEELHISKEQLNITEQQLKNAEISYKVQIISESDILEIQAQIAYEKYLITLAENNFKSANFNLLKILEKKEYEIVVEKPVISFYENDLLLPDFTDVYRTALQLPQLKTAEYQLKSTEFEKNIAKSILYPEISLKFGLYSNYSDKNYFFDSQKNSVIQSGFVGSLDGEPVFTQAYGKTKYPFTKQIYNNILPTIYISMTYPIFSKFSYKTSIEKAKIKFSNSEIVLQQTKNDLYFAIQQIYLDLKAAISEYKSSLDFLKSMEVSFQNTELKFAAGKVNSYEYNLSKNKLNIAQTNLLKAKFTIVFKRNILRFYQCKSFEL